MSHNQIKWLLLTDENNSNRNANGQDRLSWRVSQFNIDASLPMEQQTPWKSIAVVHLGNCLVSLLIHIGGAC